MFWVQGRTPDGPGVSVARGDGWASRHGGVLKQYTRAHAHTAKKMTTFASSK